MKKPVGRSARLHVGTALGLALGVVGTIGAGPALAQDGAQEDEIIVTATRRDQALQDVPVAVTPVTAAMIENSGIRDLQDLTSVAPALQFNVSENETSATARLRGIGTQGSNPGLESAVGIFIDGVYRSRNGVALTDLGEIRQVEVLRGPQGTLFGRNTSAGLISVATTGPDFNEFSAEGEFTYGDWEETRISGSVNIPVSDQLAFRLFAAQATRDGFMEVMDAAGNITDNNNRDVWTVRGQMGWAPTANFDLRIIADYSERDETCCAAQYFNPVDINGVLGATGAFPGNSATGPLFGGTAAQFWLARSGGYGPAFGAYTVPVTTTSAPAPTAAEAAAIEARLGGGGFGARRGYSDAINTQQIEDQGISAEANWDLGFGTLTSVTAYRDWAFNQGQDADFTTLSIRVRPNDGTTGFGFETFTQEFRLAGTSGPVDWLVGAYYADETLSRREGIQEGTDFGAYAAGALSPLYGPLATFLASNPGPDGVADRYEQEGTSLAFFTHNIAHFSEQTSVTLGLRFTRDEKDLTATFATEVDAQPALASITGFFGVDTNADTVADYSFAALGSCDVTQRAASNTHTLVGGVGPLAAANGQSANAVLAGLRTGYCLGSFRQALDGTRVQSREEEEFSGVLSLRHEFTDNISAYVSASRGYKSGGFNLDRDFSGVVFGDGADADTFNDDVLSVTYNSGFAPEFITAYELGIKTAWFDRDLLLNFAFYQNDIENYQLNTFNGISFQVTSVPEAESQGAELDLIWRTPVEGLSIQAGAAYTDATYGRDTAWVAATPNPITGALTNFRLPGNTLTNAPQWTSTASFTYETPIFDTMNALFYLDARYVDDQITGSNLDPAKEQPAYTLVNGRIGLYTQDERFGLEIWGRNLTDEEYHQIAFDVPLQSGSMAAFLGDPATYGVTLRARY
jgi:outer membrane receptor protein involved in Fe transport